MRGPTRSASCGQLQYETARVGGILLIIGVLHGLDILIMPVLGRLFFSPSSHFQTPAGSERSETVD